MTELVATGAIAVMASSVAAIGSWSWILGRQARRLRRENAQVAGEFFPDRYEPMVRLMTDDDLNFLRRTTCLRSGVVARWDRARRRVFRLYLKDLAGDFRCLHTEARALVAESPEQYSDLVGVLMRQQVTFWRVMAGVRVRLALGGLGVGRADIRGLIDVIEAMRLEIERSVSLASASA
jgi:hypothetical protein